MITNTLHEELNDLFATIRNTGMYAIALSENEGARMKLLNMLQYASRKEIKLKQIIADFEDKTVILSSEGISQDTIANTEGDIKVVTIEKND